MDICDGVSMTSQTGERGERGMGLAKGMKRR